MFKQITFILLYCFFFVLCSGEQNSDIINKCGENLNCLENEVIQFFDEYQNTDVPLIGNYVIFKQLGRKMSTSRSQDLIERSLDFLENHELSFSEDSGRGLFEEMRSSKIKKILLPILILLKLKALIIIPAVLSAIAMVAFKGLGASLIALAISGASGLKSILEHHTSKLTYEVVPQISPSHWSRTGLDPTHLSSHPAAAMTPLASGYHTIP